LKALEAKSAQGGLTTIELGASFRWFVKYSCSTALVHH
jgi:hypothetical protein